MKPFLRYLHDYWVSFLLAISSALIAAPSILPEHENKTARYLFMFGVILTTIALIAQAKQAGTISSAEERNETLQEEFKNLQSSNLFMISSAITDPWQAELLQRLSDKLQKNGFVCSYFTPPQNHSRGDHSNFLEYIKKHQSRFIGGIIIPNFPEKGNDIYLKFAKEYNKPIIFVDNPPSEDQGDYPDHTCFCGIDSRKGGQLAAKAALLFNAKSPLNRVLVIAAPSQTRRQELFKEEMGILLPNCEVIINLQGEFDREKAAFAASATLLRAIQNSEPFQLVFCTSDAMTLGCLDAINVNRAEFGAAIPKIIGYDGVYETEMLAQIQDSPIINVIQQKTDILTAHIVQDLQDLLNKKRKTALRYDDPFLLFEE